MSEFVPVERVGYPDEPWVGTALNFGKAVAVEGGRALISRYLKGNASSTASAGLFPQGSDIDIMGEKEFRKYQTGGRRRRRRRRLLTASDKADVAFLIGQLGTGQLGRSALSAILSRRTA